MSPIRSTFGKSVGKLLKVFRDRDLTLNSDVVTNRKIPGLLSGGIETTYGGYKVHTFLTSGSLVVNAVPLTFVADVLVVGGGGAGGSGNSGAYETGGGGAGGFREVSSHPIQNGTFTITVGDGGTADQTSEPPNYGGYSELATPSPIRAEGGGAGGMGPINPGGYGGSAGGNRRTGTTPISAANRVAGPAGDNPAPATPGQGNGGGAAVNDGSSSGGGGGGGAGGAGNAAGSNQGGAGGVGRSNSYRTGSSVLYGGGGGGVGFSGGPGSGGPGGGGAGGTAGNPGNPGTVNTGGGGGGADASSPANAGGSGGPGIVVIRYLLSSL